MSSRVVLVSLGGSAQGLASALSRLDLSVSVARDLNAALLELADSQLIVVEASDTASLALLCRRINDEAGSSHPPMLAVVAARDVETRVKVLEAGADDVLAQPIDERELAAMVDALLLRSNPASRGQVPAASPTAPRPQAAPGRVIVFASAKGGSGTTTLAVNTALLLAEMAPGNVAIADMDMFHGQVSTHLDIYGRGSTATLAREDLRSQTPEMIADSGRLHPSGLMVYGGPYRPDDAQGVTSDHLKALLATLRGMYATVVVDGGSTLDGRAMTVLNAADRLAIVVTPDIPALRLLHAALEVLSELGNAADRTTFVVNDVYPKSSISADQIEEHLSIRVGLTVPYDSENFLRGINEGHPIVALSRRSAAAAALRKLAEMLADNDVEDGAPRPQRKGRLGGLFGRN
ncbi:MAG: pilus assembly protein CpaE [Chloroflexota bacterium]|nr:pilus assembly protein CpaE [Chloroflexota bacterium]